MPWAVVEVPKISCSNWGYREWTLADVISSIAGIGYGAIEIVTHGLGWPIGYHLNPDFDRSYIEGLNGTLQAHKVKVACISPSNDFYRPRDGSREREVEHVNRNIDLAVKVGAPIIRIQATGLRDIPEGISRSSFIETIVDALGKCVDYGKSQGVKLAIETHGGVWALVPENMRDLLDAVRSDCLGICLHTHIDYTVETVSTLGGKVLHVHLSETSRVAQRSYYIGALRRRGRSDSDIMMELGITGEEFDEASSWEPREIYLGDGEVDFERIFRGLKDAGYSGWWNFEGHSTVDPEEDARRAYGYIEGSLRKMTTR